MNNGWRWVEALQEQVTQVRIGQSMLEQAINELRQTLTDHNAR